MFTPKLLRRVIGGSLLVGSAVGIAYYERDYRQRFPTQQPHTPTRLQALLSYTPDFVTKNLVYSCSTETVVMLVEETPEFMVSLPISQQNALIIHDVKFLELVPLDNILPATVNYLLHTETNSETDNLEVTPKLADAVCNYLNKSKPNDLMKPSLFIKLAKLRPELLLANTGTCKFWYDETVIMEIVKDNLENSNYIEEHHYPHFILTEIIKQYEVKYPDLSLNQAEFWQKVVSDIPACTHYLQQYAFYDKIFEDEEVCKNIVNHPHQAFLHKIPFKYRTKELFDMACKVNESNFFTPCPHNQTTITE